MESQIEYEIRPQGNFSFGFQELWQYRELFYFFTWRDIKVKYKNTSLGIAWAVLQPFMLMIIFTLVFNKGLKIESGELPYPVFAYSGLLLWQVFSGGLTNAANSILSNARIIQKIYFPRLIIPLSAILTAVIDFCFAMLVFVGLMLYYGVEVQPLVWLGFFLLSLLLTVFSTTGLSLFLAAWNLKYRDFQYVIPFLLQVLFFLSPVLYEPGHFENSLFSKVLEFNPMSGAIHLARAAFSSQPVDWGLVGQSTLIASFLLIAGLFTFRKMEGYFADIA